MLSWHDLLVDLIFMEVLNMHVISHLQYSIRYTFIRDYSKLVHTSAYFVIF
jgi:hypothetical protein